MSRKQCYSFSSAQNCDIFPDNTCSSFRNLFDLDNSQGEYFIALDFIVPGNFLQRYKRQRCAIEVDVINEQENGCDRCIVSLVLGAYHRLNPVFIPLTAKQFSQIHITLMDPTQKKPFISPISSEEDHTWASFQVKKMFHGQKRL